MANKNNKKKRAFILMTFFSLLILLFLLTEITFRFFWDGKPRASKWQRISYFHPVDDEDIGYVLTPNHKYRYTTHKSNADGFRILPKISRAKKDDVYRVALLGDSIIYGTNTKDKNLVSNTLQRRLNILNVNDYKQIQVLNFGIPGHNMTQYLAVLKRYALNYEPDLVIIGITIFNDFDGFYIRYLGNGNIYAVPKYTIHGYKYKHRAPSWIVWNSYLLRYIYYGIAPNWSVVRKGIGNTKDEYKLIRNYLPASCDRTDEIWNDIREIVAEMKSISKLYSVKILFLIFPSPAQVVYKNVPLTTQRLITEILDNNDIQYADLLDLFRDLFKSTKYPPFRDDGGHPDNIMTDYIGCSLVDWMLDKKLIDIAEWKSEELKIDFQTNKNLLSYGWDKMIGRKKQNLWISGNMARITIPKFKKKIKTITIKCKRFIQCKKQTMNVYLNSIKLARINLTPAVVNMKTFKIELKNAYSLKNINFLDFKFSNAKMPLNTHHSKLNTPKFFAAAVKEITIK